MSRAGTWRRSGKKKVRSERMKRVLCFLLAAALLGSSALASLSAPVDALGLYTPLDEAQTLAEQEAVRAALGLILEEDMTQGEMATVIHDWVVLNCRYSLTRYRDMSYGALVDGKAACRGYTRAYVALARAAGLDCEYSFSLALEHAWALVALDGSYYYVDPTWDDSHYERIGFVNHRHFFFNSADERQFSHYGGDSDIWAAGGIYEAAPWRAAVSRVIFQGDYAYYLDGDFQLIRCHRQSWETEVLLRCEERWPDFYELDGSEALATGLVLMRGRLWFNTPTAIVSVNLKGGDWREELAPDTQGGYICGIDVREGRLVYTLAQQQDSAAVKPVDAGISGWGAWGCEYDAGDFWALFKKQ